VLNQEGYFSWQTAVSAFISLWQRAKSQSMQSRKLRMEQTEQAKSSLRVREGAFSMNASMCASVLNQTKPALKNNKGVE